MKKEQNIKYANIHEIQTIITIANLTNPMFKTMLC